jgi:hypothetical protein
VSAPGRRDLDDELLELLRELTRERDPLPPALHAALYAMAPGPPEAAGAEP